MGLVLKCCAWQLLAAFAPRFPEFNAHCSLGHAVGDRDLWLAGEALQAQLGRRLMVSYCVPLNVLAESLRSDTDYEARQFRSRTVQLVVTTGRGRVICALDITAPADKVKEQMLREMGIRYRHFAPGAQAAELKAFVKARHAVKPEPSVLFRPIKTLLSPLQLHFMRIMLQPLARTWGARVLLHADGASVTGAAASEPGLNFEFLLTSLDGKYAIAITMREVMNDPKSEDARQTMELRNMCGLTRAFINVWPRDFNLGTCREFRLLARHIRDQMRANAGLRPETGNSLLMWGKSRGRVDDFSCTRNVYTSLCHAGISRNNDFSDCSQA